MPYIKDDNGESIWITPSQLKELKAAEDPNGKPCAEGLTRCKDGTCRDMKGMTSWKPGQSGNPNGRPKGSKNKKTLKRIAQEKGYMTGYELLSEVANDETMNMNQRMTAAEKIMKFEQPALSSVELHTDDDKKVPFSITLTDVDSDTPKDNKDPDKDA